MLVSVDEIRFDPELYPRFEANNATVNQYRQSIDSLPPILVTKKKELEEGTFKHDIIDGYHRLLAHKLEGRTEIEVDIFDSEDPQEILIEAIYRNNSHGRQLSTKEKRKNAQRLFNLGVVDLEKIASILSVTTRSASNYTKDLRKKAGEERDAEILDLYLQCYSYREIEEKLGIGRSTTTKAVQKGISSKMDHIQPDDLQLYNVWNVGRLSPDQMRYPGQTPKEIIENIIYYYTEPPQTEPRLKLSKIIDPMAGSGIVRDVCKNLLRRYILYDLNPIREDIPIHKNDILKGFPDKAKDADLVYFDPPYFNLMSEYPKNAFTESYDSFLKAMETSLENIQPILNESGKVALILKPMNEEMLGGDWLDLTFDSINIAKELGYTLLKRISAPLSTQQFGPNDVTRAKELGVILNTLRDIVIFGKDGI